MLLNCGAGGDSWESLDCKKSQPVHPKENQSWIFIGRTDVEAETPIFWPPDAKNWLIWKDPDAEKDWRREDRGQQRMRWFHGIIDSMDMSCVTSGSWWWTGRTGVGSQRVRHDWVTELNWTEPKRGRQKSVGNRVAWWKDPGTSLMLWNCWINQP